MTNLDITRTTVSTYDSDTNFPVSITETDTEGVNQGGERRITYPDWKTRWSQFNKVPDLKSAIILKAIWVVGKGWKSDPDTKIILENIKGWGKDHIDNIFFNMKVVSMICGDAFGHIIWDKKQGIPINIKPLNPGCVNTIIDKSGMLIRYELMSRFPGKETLIIQPEDMWHLRNNGVADNIPGISDLECLEETFLADNENFDDRRKFMHRFSRPLMIWKLKTADQTKIDDFVAKIAAGRKAGNNDIFVPDDENLLSWEVVDMPVPSALFEQAREITQRFYRSIGLPELLPSGGSNASESGGKVGYLGFEQVVAREQKDFEMSVWNQLCCEIKLIPPSTLIPTMQTDENKDAGYQARIAAAGETNA